MAGEGSRDSVKALERRCPRLGSRITFAYCLQGGEDAASPCWKSYDCWWEIFDVAAYLEAHLPEDTLQRLSAKAQGPPPNKLLSIVDIARQAKEQKENG
jgi:hypothetical protein